MNIKLKLSINRICLILFIVVTSCLLHPIYAQNEITKDSLWYIETKRGKGYLCTITKRTENEILIKKKSGLEKAIKNKRIRSIVHVREDQKILKNKYWPVQLSARRNFGSPTAFNLKSGQVHFQTFYGILYQLETGVTDHFSVEAGTSIVGLISGGENPVWIAPKVFLPAIKDRIQFGIGAYVGALYERDPTINVFPYFTTTIGSPNVNFSMGVGFPLDEDDLDGRRLGLLSFSGRLSKRTYFKWENFLFLMPDLDYSITFIGLRTSWHHVSINYGALMEINPGYGTYVIPIPLVSTTISF